MNNSIQKLFDFIAASEKSRKYLPNTASAFRTPLRLIDTELNAEEGSSLESLKNNLDQIFDFFYSKNQSKYSAASIEVYKRRVSSLLSDYEKYGSDPGKMAAWNREITQRKRNKVSAERPVGSNGNQLGLPDVNGLGEGKQGGTVRNEVPLDNQRKIVIFTPPDLAPDEVDKLDAFITYLRTIAGGSVKNNNDTGGLA